jgi:iron-sulfur cluster assembly protein
MRRARRAATAHGSQRSPHNPIRPRGFLVLTLTDNAVSAIRDLMVGEDLPEEAGMRIASTPDDAASLELSLASGPQAGDQVIEKEDVRVFLEGTAAALLDDKKLDAEVSSVGRPSFRVAQQ